MNQHGTFTKTLTKKVSLDYILTPPNGRKRVDKGLPLVVFLHGLGERGPDPERVYIHGLARLLKEGKSFPFLTLSPQCPAGTFWTEETDALHALIMMVVKKYGVDESRIYITGLSMGGYGTYEMVARYPDLFAAAVPICGGILNRLVLRKLAQIPEVPMWIFHGKLDDVVPVSESQTVYRSLRKAGWKSLRMTLYDDLRHDAWTRTYDNPEVYDFLLEHMKSGRKVAESRIPNGMPERRTLWTDDDPK
jgi:predicted peptidase